MIVNFITNIVRETIRSHTVVEQSYQLCQFHRFPRCYPQLSWNRTEVKHKTTGSNLARQQWRHGFLVISSWRRSSADVWEKAWHWYVCPHMNHAVAKIRRYCGDSRITFWFIWSRHRFRGKHISWLRGWFLVIII